MIIVKKAELTLKVASKVIHYGVYLVALVALPILWHNHTAVPLTWPQAVGAGVLNTGVVIGCMETMYRVLRAR